MRKICIEIFIRFLGASRARLRGGGSAAGPGFPLLCFLDGSGASAGAVQKTYRFNPLRFRKAAFFRSRTSGNRGFYFHAVPQGYAGINDGH
jgi:hypothetical protein